MSIRLFIICCSILSMMLLIGCAADAGRRADGVSPGIVEQEIRLRTSGAHEVVGELRSPEGFYGIATVLPEVVSEQMLLKKSWKEGCPVALADLSYLVLTHWGFDGKPKIGEMVVHRKLALPVISAFADLFAAHYPIEKMELIDVYDASDDLSMEANNSSSFNCRDIVGKPGMFSKHSYGGAIDINPLLNPYVSPGNVPLTAMGWDGIEDKGIFLSNNGYDTSSPALTFCYQRPADCLVLPAAGTAHVDRSLAMPGYLLPGSPAVTAFTGRSFDWGGSWGRLLDYQHFEYDTAKILQK